MGVTHTFTSAKSDGGDTSIVRPSDWNATHTISNGTTAAPGIAPTADSTKGFAFNTANQIDICTGGASRLLINNTAITTSNYINASQFNGMNITNPGGVASTLTVGAGGTLQLTGAFVMNLTCGAATTPTFPSGTGTLVYIGGTNTWGATQTFSVTPTLTQAATFTAYAGNTTNGSIWYDSTQKSTGAYSNTLKQMLVGCIFTQTATGTNGAATAITNILGTGVGTAVLPASWTLIGKTIRIRVWGTVTTAAAPGTTVITLRWNAGTPVTIVASPSLTLTASMTSMPFLIEFDMTCRTTTTVIGGGRFSVSSSTTGVTSLVVGIATTTAATVVAATSYTLQVCSTNGTASGTVYTTQGSNIEILN